jgi:glutamyl endopeptidase
VRPRPLLARVVALATVAALGGGPGGADRAGATGTSVLVLSDADEERTLVLPPVAERGGVRPGSVGSGAESVSRPDGRHRVRRPSTYPNRVVGQIQHVQGTSGWRCSGWLIDTNTVLTSGHCVHEGGAGGVWSTDLRFSPARQRRAGVVTSPFGTCGAEELWAPQQWVEDGAEAHDWGLVQLDCAVGAVTGWLGFYSLPGPSDLRGATVMVQGYPSDKPFGSYWKDRGTAVGSNRSFVFYDADTFGGQSGSPVWHRRSGCGPCAVAIHSYGFHGSGLHVRANHGPRINPVRFEVFEALAADNDP